MATLATLNLGVVEHVAAQTAALLEGNPRFRQAGDAPPLATLHEYFPLWCLGSDALERLRRDVAVGVDDIDLMTYLERSALWLYQLHRGGQPVGHVLAREAAGGQRVIEVSETSEALQLALAVTRVDDASTDEPLEAAILDCPSLGAAALLLVRPDGRAAQLCLYRNPVTTDDAGPGAAVTASQFIDSLLAGLRRRAGLAPAILR